MFHSCKQSEKVKPEAANVNFIKRATIKGAIAYLDTLQGYIQVELPESYSSDTLDLKLSFPPRVGTAPSVIHADSSEIILSYNFAGKEPKLVPLYQSDGAKVRFKYFKVFVKHLGPLKVNVEDKKIYYNPLAQDIGPADDGFIKLKLKSGLGSIPDSPSDTSRLVPVLCEVAKNITIRGSYDDFYDIAGFEGISPFFGSKSVRIGFTYGDRISLHPDPIQVLRAPPSARIDLNYKYFKFLKHGDIVDVNGGFFLPESKYQLEFSGPTVTKSTTVGLSRNNHHALKLVMPESIPEGSYKVSSFEDGKLMSHSIYHVSNNNTSVGINYIWKDDWECPSKNFVDLPPEEVKVMRGEYVNVNPFPIIVHSKSSAFDPKKFAFKLILRNQEKEFIIDPEPRADGCYGDQSLFMYYGRYSIPKELAPGLYEASLMNAVGKPSLPSWQKIIVNNDGK